jgi:hypothetical protein
MTMKQLASELCKVEGLKHEMTIGDAREFLAKLSDKMYAEPTIASMLINNGAKRAKRRKGR